MITLQQLDASLEVKRVNTELWWEKKKTLLAQCDKSKGSGSGPEEDIFG